MILAEDYLVIDIETANKDRDSICQIGLTYVSSETIRSVKTININPECQFDAFNINLHGITDADVKNSKPFNQIFPILNQILRRCTVYHHGVFDPYTIQRACERYGLSSIDVEWSNSIDIFKHCWLSPIDSFYKLSNLCKNHKINIPHRNAGQASFVTAQLLNLAANKRPIKIPPEFLNKNIEGKFSGKP